MAVRRLRSAVGLALAAWAIPASAICVQLEGASRPETRLEMPTDAKRLEAKSLRWVDPLKAVYSRVSMAARRAPALVVCERPMATASARKLGALQSSIESAKAIAQDQYRRSGNADAAIRSAVAFHVVNTLGFSRDVEREADAKGFSLAVTLAGFDAGGFGRVSRKFGELPTAQRPEYLSSHPGWFERIEKSDLRAANQNFLAAAQMLADNKEWGELVGHVDVWLRKLPTSGAAWYYRALGLARAKRPIGEVAAAYEEAAGWFSGESELGALAQEDQAESGKAWQALCRALRAEGYARESAHCALRIADPTERNRFVVEAFGGMLFIDGRSAGSANLLVARERSGGKLITNDATIAARRGSYGGLPPDWRAIRPPGSAAR